MNITLEPICMMCSDKGMIITLSLLSIVLLFFAFGEDGVRWLNDRKENEH